MADENKDSKKKVINDVAKPGKTAPSPTSRPIITHHGPMMQDPMVQESPSKTEQPEKVPGKGVKLEPTGPVVAEAKVPEEKVAADTNSPVIEEAAEPAAEAEPATPAQPAEPSNDNDTALVESVAEQAAANKKQAEEAKKQQEQQAKVTELINGKKYFVPINVAKRKRGNRLAVILLIVVVLIAAGAYAYTAEIIKF